MELSKALYSLCCRKNAQRTNPVHPCWAVFTLSGITDIISVDCNCVHSRAVPDLFFPIRPEPDFAGFEMTNLAGAGTGAGFSN